MRYYAQSQLALRRSDGILECWEDCRRRVSFCITPLLHYSKGIGFNKRTEAEGDASHSMISLLPEGDKKCSLASLREPAN